MSVGAASWWSDAKYVLAITTVVLSSSLAAVSKLTDCALLDDSPEGVRQRFDITTVSGFRCAGYNETQSCCDALQIHQVISFLNFAVDHNRKQLESFDQIVADAEEAISATSTTECGAVVEQILSPRLQFLIQAKPRSIEALEHVEHLIMSAACSTCLPEDPLSEWRVSQSDGPAALGLTSIALSVQAGQQLITEIDVEVLSDTQSSHRCLPQYLRDITKGIRIGNQVDTTAWVGNLGNTPPESSSGAMRAVERQRNWPQERRLTGRDPAKVADHLQETGERLLAFIFGPAGRMVHQLQLLMLAFRWPLREQGATKFLWGAHQQGLQDQSDEGKSELSIASDLDESMPTSSENEDPGSRFGLVILISNRTDGDVVEHLARRLTGQRTLFLEDVCGEAAETLGQGCHGGGPQQVRCLFPVHVGKIALETQNIGLGPVQAWRRHGATRSVLHTARSLASSLWGADSSVWVADFRPEAKCPGAHRLEDVVANLLPKAKLELIQDPAQLFGMPVDAFEPKLPGSDSQADAGNSGIYPDKPLAARLAEYLEFHKKGVAELAANATAVPTLVWSCQPYAQCGGHGDRLNGIVTAFLLAVLTRRVFLIDSENPFPLHSLLAPNLLDWRVQGTMFATALLRHHSYHDRRHQFEADIERLATFTDQILVLSLNYRMIRVLFEAPTLQSEVEMLGLPLRSPEFLVAEIFEILFSPTPALRHEVSALRTELGGLQDGRFVAVHLRTGDISWDPARHGKDELENFLTCAQQAQSEQGLPSDTPWLLSTDSEEVALAATSQSHNGKLRVPGKKGRIHIDRSDFLDVLEGVAANYAEWMLFGRAAAVVLSRSYFGELAAEVGRVRFAYFAAGGNCVRIDLTTS